MRIGGFRLNWLRRRWWVVATSVAAVTIVALIAQPPMSTRYTAESVLLVRSGATPNTPGSANEANRLAVTYAQLIPQDSLVLDRAARTLNVPRDSVRSAVSITNDAGTSILRVRYTSKDSGLAVTGARAMADALAGTSPASTNFNGLAISSLPDKAAAISSSGSNLPSALVLGLCLGLVLVIAWERSDGRIDDAADVEQELSCPVSSLEGMSNASIVALLERWKVLADHGPADIALVSVGQGQRSVTAEVALVFAAAAGAEEGEDDVSGGALKGLRLHSAGSAGTWEVGEAVAQRCDLTVLVAAEGTAVRELRSSVTALKQFGVKPAWAFFASEPIVRRARRRHGVGEPVSVDVGAHDPTL